MKAVLRVHGRLPRVPLGGCATSRSPLAALVARGAGENINVGEVVLDNVTFSTVGPDDRDDICTDNVGSLRR